MMPRMVDRSYRTLAESQNRKMWADLGSIGADVMVQRALPQIEDNAHRSQMMHLQVRRERLVREIIMASEHPAVFFNHRYFRYCQRAIISTDEAVIELRRLIVKNRMKRGHYTYNPSIIPQLQEALVFSRFFRRFGRRIWSLDRAAA